MSWVSVGIAAVSLGAGAYSASEQSKAAAKAQPNLAASSAELSDAQARLLPIQRQLEAAAQRGGKVTIDNFPAHQADFYWVPAGSTYGSAGDNLKDALKPDPTGTGLVTSYNLFNKKKKQQWLPVLASEWEEGGKFAGQEKPKFGGGKMQVPEGPKTFDFTGYGQADVQAKLADAQAKLGLDIAKKYDSQFIAESLRQQAEADPEGTAARAKMSELIQSQIERNPDRPIADMLDRQVAEALAAAGKHGLSDPDQARLDAAVADALAGRGGSGTAANFSQPLTTGFAGEQREAQARQDAAGWLASGATPEDTAYRREQQNLENLSALVNGRTPQSQFRSLTGAQNGPTPMVKGNALPTLPGGTEAAAHSTALSNWRTQQAFDANQVNPWMVGLTSAINLAGAAGNAGYKPLGRN